MRASPYNIAHQGASGLAPSNTLAAFRRAVELGADIIEIDIVTHRRWRGRRQPRHHP